MGLLTKKFLKLLEGHFYTVKMALLHFWGGTFGELGAFSILLYAKKYKFLNFCYKRAKTLVGKRATTGGEFGRAGGEFPHQLTC